LRVRGARQHNLQGIDVDVPHGSLCVVTGVSGSGKSSLALDTIYAEARRRYLASLSLEVRALLAGWERPEVDAVLGLPPAVAVTARGAAGAGPRATVATLTEVYDHLQVLFAHLGVPHCPRCGARLEALPVATMVDRLLVACGGARVVVLGPLPAEGGPEARRALLEELAGQGFARVRVDGRVVRLDEGEPGVDAAAAGSLELVVDRLTVGPEARDRLAEALETALRAAGGVVRVEALDPGGPTFVWSDRLLCPSCRVAVPPLQPALFSFQRPEGACPACGGLGQEPRVDPDLVLPDPRLSVAEGALRPRAVWEGPGAAALADALARAGVAQDVPLSEATPAQRAYLLQGDPAGARRGAGRSAWPGAVAFLEALGRQPMAPDLRAALEEVVRPLPCAACGGSRLRPEALAVRVAGRSLAEAVALPAGEALAWVQGLRAEDDRSGRLLAPVREALLQRLETLVSLGLGYLPLDRPAERLATGELGRLRLAAPAGAGLTGVLYVLDEPSLGLHPRDLERVLDVLRALRDAGNTVLVVDHAEALVRAADHVVDIGPGAGRAGGRVVVQGTPAEVMACPASLTGRYLRGRRAAARSRRAPRGALAVRRATWGNLRGLDVDVPLGCLVAVVGVSGAGKTTLVHGVLLPHLRSALGEGAGRPLPPAEVRGAEQVRRVVAVDEAPLGRTPRSTPATATGILDELRDLFARTPAARARGYDRSRFSFNVPGGRCEACAGEGSVRASMGLLPDVRLPCPVCQGTRYARETLEVRYRGLSIADCLGLTAEEALATFRAVPSLRRRLQALVDAGLGYLPLGQPATELSSGEARRLKLAQALGRAVPGGGLYVLDEPTAGLHPADADRLVALFHRLVDAGDTVLVVTHDPYVAAAADWIVELGPGPGEAGGRVVAQGTPEAVARDPASPTAPYLAAALEGVPA
jgi:excinuclease ABC subunit A